MSHTPLDASAPHRLAPGSVPPAPAPVVAEQPAPRVVWEDGGGSAHWIRLTALDWSDGAPPTYQVQAAHGHSWWAPGDGMLWAPATGEERDRMFFALAAAVDERAQHREPAP